MIAQVKTIDNQKRLLSVSGAIPTGNPVGSYLYTNKQLQPRNYLYCDGSSFNQNTYPALYLYLGTNVLPDCRGGTEYVYIKAVDGVDISDEDTFLNTVKNYVDGQVEDANSYSTAETLTGGKWVDNKPIYKRVFQKQCGSGNTDVYDFGSNTYIDTVVSSTVSIKQSNNAITLGSYYQGSSDLANIYINASGKLVFRSGSNYAYGFVTIILEYTKTID